MTDSEPCPLKKILTLFFCLPPLFLSLSTSSSFTSLTPPPHVLSMPLNLQICVSTHILPVFTSDFLSLLYPSLIHLCLKSLSSPFTNPTHLNNPLTVFIHLFSLFPFPLCLTLSSFHLPFISPCCLSLPFSPPLSFSSYISST